MSAACKWIRPAAREECVSQMEFQEFYRGTRDRCLQAVAAGTGDPHLAEDLVAEAYTRAWTAWRTVRRHPAPAAWVVRTALNLRISWWRRRRREVGWPEGAEARGGVVAGVDAAGGSELVDPGLLAILRTLPPRQREVIAYRVFLDLDTQATAEVLGIAPGTVTAHLARAVATLRGHLTAVRSAESSDSARTADNSKNLEVGP